MTQDSGSLTPFFGDSEPLDQDEAPPGISSEGPDKKKWTSWFRSHSLQESAVSFPDDEESLGLPDVLEDDTTSMGTVDLPIRPLNNNKMMRRSSTGSSSLSRMISHVKIKKNIKSFGDAINAPACPSVPSFAAADGPMNELWNVQRLKSYQPRKKNPPTFTDAWILRELKLTDEVDPQTPFPAHLKDRGPDTAHDQHTAFAIWKLSLSACGEWLLAGTQRGWVYLYKTEKGHPLGLFGDKPVGIFKAHEGSVVDIAWLPRGPSEVPMFVTIGFDRRLCLWLCDSPAPIESVRTSEWASSITIHPKDPTQLFLGSLDATVQLWRLQVDELDGKVTTRMSMIDYVRVPDVVTAVSVSPDGQFLAVGVRRGSVAIYDSHSLRFMTEVECQQKRTKRWRSVSHRIVGINWSPDSERFVATAHDSSLRLVNLRLDGGISEQAVTKLTGHTLQYLLLAGSFVQSDPSAEKVLIGSEDDHLYVYSNLGANAVPTVDKIKICRENITACIGTNREFDQFLNNEVHSALTYKLGNHYDEGKSEDVRDEDLSEGPAKEEKPFRTSPAEHQSLSVAQERWTRPMYLSAIVGTYNGAIKVFVNFGLGHT